MAHGVRYVGCSTTQHLRVSAIGLL